MSGHSEPAYPVPPYTDPRGDFIFPFHGLTKREAAAIAAMQGALAGLPPSANYDAAVTARVAVQHADALLAELDKPA